MKKKNNKFFYFSIGSSSYGCDGIFGGCAFASFKVNEKNLKILKKSKWFKALLDEADLKNISNDWIMFLSREIKNVFKEGKDFCISYIDARRYNKMFKSHRGQYSKEKIESLFHNLVQRQLIQKLEPTRHVVNDFLGNRQWIYKEINWKDDAVEIDDFCPEGEKEYLSIKIAHILAKNYYLEQFRGIQIKFGFCLTNRHNHLYTNEAFKKIKKHHGFFRKSIFKHCKNIKLDKYHKYLEETNPK